MNAAYITQTGEPDVIQYGEVPTPSPQDSEVLIKVGAVSVNPIDTYVRSGAVRKELPFPYVVGADFAGEVVAVGPAARQLTVGQRVWGCNWHEPPEQGTFSEFVCTDENWVYPLEPNVAFEQGAALALVGITAHLGLVREAELTGGETVFVNGGAGSVGSAVIQMAKALGARVITTAGSPSKADLCRSLGADIAIEYRRECLDAALQHARDGVDVWFDVTRTPDLELAVKSLSPRGRLVVISGRDASSPFPVGPFYVKCCRMSGFQMTLASAEDRAAAASDMNQWMAEGRLQANIGRVLPLSQAAESHRLQEEMTVAGTSEITGKIVLQT